MYNKGDAANAFTEAYRWNVDTVNGNRAPVVETEAEMVDIVVEESVVGYAISKKR